MRNRLIFTLLLLTGFYACKKDDGGIPQATPTPDTTQTQTTTSPVCRITTADAFTGSSTERNTIAYDEQGRITSVSTNGQTTNVTYSGNAVFVTRSNGYDTLTLNGAGLVTQKRSRAIGSGSSFHYRTDYTYSGTEVQRAAIVMTYSGTVLDSSVSNYTWSDGNCIGRVDNGHYSNYEFYTDKPVPTTGGDYFSFVEILSTGNYVVRNKNLTKRVSYVSGGAFDLSYEFDSEGRVAKASLLNGSSSGQGYQYMYTCK